MARNIADIHAIILYLVRKERGGFVAPSDIDTMLDVGQKDLFLEYRKEYIETTQLNIALSPFKKRLSFSNATSQNGLVAVPADYEFFLNGYTVTYNNLRGRQENKIVPVNEDEKVIALNSQLRPVSATNPIMVQGGGYFVLYPQQPMAGEINYVATPVTPIYAYTQVGRVVTYDPNNSVQLQWRDAFVNKVISNALSYIGINLNEQQVMQFSELKEREVPQ